MNIAQLVAGADTGGQTGATATAFAKFAPEDTVRNVLAAQNYLQYPTEGYQRWSSSDEFRAVARDLYQWADIVLFTNSLELYHAVDSGEKKPTILIHRGTRYRNNPMAVFGEADKVGAKQVVSTVDLLLAYPEGGAEWMPLVTDMQLMSKYRKLGRRRRNKTIRIVHSPTARAIKGTEAVLAAIDKLSRRYDIELDLIEGATWDECLRRKANADIFVDQLILGYGNNALEAWAMGIPVVAGATPDILAEMKKAFHTDQLPFATATQENVYKVLERLIKSKSARDDARDIGAAHVNKFHASEVVVPFMQSLFRRVPPSKGTATAEEKADEMATRQSSGRYVPLRLRRSGPESAQL